MIVVTGFTTNGGYAEFVPGWQADVNRWFPDASQLVMCYGHTRRWIDAAHRKPGAILKAWQADEGDVLWLDVDAHVNRTPDLIHKLVAGEAHADIAFRQFGAHSCTGTFYARRSSLLVGQLIEHWSLRSEGAQDARNQLIFESILPSYRRDLGILDLPMSYCYLIPWEDPNLRDKVVISHEMHARKQPALGRK